MYNWQSREEVPVITEPGPRNVTAPSDKGPPYSMYLKRSVCQGFWKSWLVIGKNIRNDSGNCHIVGIDLDLIMMSPRVLLKCCYQFGFLIPLARQPCSENFPALHEVLMIWTGSGITDLLWNVNAVRWCRRGITAQEWKVNIGKIEVIPFVVKPSSTLSIVNVNVENNPSIRKRLQTPLFPLFQVHVDRQIPNTLQILCFFRDKNHLYICRWNWIVVQGVSWLLWEGFVQTPPHTSIKTSRQATVHM